MSLVPISESVIRDAEALSPTGLGTLDAIHLATALELSSASELRLLTYDRELQQAASERRLAVLAP